MRIRRLYLLYALSLFLIINDSVLAQSWSSSLAMEVKKSKKELIMALRKYGWAIPLCVQPINPKVPPYCVSVSRLIKTYPLHTELIQSLILRAANSAYNSRGRREFEYEKVIEKILEEGFVIGCIPAGRNKGIITLGSVLSSGSNPADIFNEICKDPNIQTITFGSLLDHYSNMGYISMSEDGQARYEYYYEECTARRAGGIMFGRFASGGGGGDDFHKKKLAKLKEKAKEAREKANEAKEKATEAEKKASEAKEAYDNAIENANNVAADPSATPDEINAAYSAVVTAGNDYFAAKGAADNARVEADAAQAEADQAQREVNAQEMRMEYGRLVQKATDELGERMKASGSGWATFWWEYQSKVLGAWWGTYGPGGVMDCLAADYCDFMSCEEYAMVRAITDELSRYKDRECNWDVMPIPDNVNNQCYNFLDGFLRVPQSTLKALHEWGCKELEKFDIICPELVDMGGYSFDPCRGPLVMCAPDMAEVTNFASNIQSQNIPEAYNHLDSGIWSNPDRNPQGKPDDSSSDDPRPPRN